MAAACTGGAPDQSPHEVLVGDSLGQLGSETAPEVARYATGTRFDLVVSSEEDLDEGWLIATPDPELLSVEPTALVGGTAVSAAVQAVAAGDTTIEAYDEADRLAASVAVQVRDADHIELSTTAAGLAYAVGERLRLLPGSAVNLMINYVGDGQFLAGRGLAGVETATDLASIADLNLGTTAVESLYVRALPSGSYTAQLRIDGRDGDQLEVISVPPDEVALVLHGPGPDPGDLACATAELVDAAGRRVFAEPAQWTSDGDRLGEGERLCIAVDPAAPPTTATVAYGPFTGTIELPGGQPPS